MAKMPWDALPVEEQKRLLDAMVGKNSLIELPPGFDMRNFVISGRGPQNVQKGDTFYYQGVPMVMDPTIADLPETRQQAPTDTRIKGRTYDMMIMDEAVTAEEPKMFKLPDNAIQRLLNLKQIVKDFPEKIKVDSTFHQVEQVRTDAKELAKLIEQARVDAKAPYLAQGNTVDEAAKVFANPLKDIIDRCDKLRVQYRDEQVKAQAVDVPKASDPFTVPDLSSFAGSVSAPPPVLKTRTHQVVDVFDAGRIPTKYFVMDMVALRKDLLAGVDVPGAKLVDKEILL